MKPAIRFLFAIATLTAAALFGIALARAFNRTLGVLIFG